MVLQFRLTDKFGDNGIVSVMILLPAKGEPGVLDIVNWVMSCRVFGRQLEDEAMNILIEMASARGVHTLRAEYIPTARNAVVKNLFERLGFSRDKADSSTDASSRWLLTVADYVAHPTQIAREKAA
jgi:FkbH-like protein